MCILFAKYNVPKLMQEEMKNFNISIYLYLTQIYIEEIVYVNKMFP